MQHQILNSSGKPIPKITYKDGSPVVLNKMELANAHWIERQLVERKNALGFEVPITTMTAIQKTMVDQKFYEFDITKYVPIEVGNAAYATSIITYRSFYSGGDFESGFMNNGTGGNRKPQADARFDAVPVQTQAWADTVSWNIFEIRQAQQNNQLIDLITQKQKASKKMWDLGIQSIAFLGSKSNSNIKGLLTQSGVTSNTSVMTKKISSMSDTEFQNFVAGLLPAFYAVCNYTSRPDTLILPFDDFAGLVTPMNTNFGFKSKGEYLLDALKVGTQNPNFQILPLAYSMQANNSTVSGLNKNRAVLFNNTSDVIRMDIPVPFTNTLQNTLNNFDYQSVAFGQLTGAQVYRPLEMLYLDY